MPTLDELIQQEAEPLLRKEVIPSREQQAGSRGAAVFAGGTAGSMLGMPLGPMGAVAGGALGAAAGSVGHDLLRGENDPIDIMKAALMEAGIDVGAMGVGRLTRLAGRFAKRLGVNAVAGIKAPQRALAARSEQLGIPADPMSVATKQGPQQIANVVGAVPVVGAPLRQAEARRTAAAARALGEKVIDTPFEDAFMRSVTRNADGEVTNISFKQLDRAFGMYNKGGKRFQKLMKKFAKGGGSPKDFVETYDLAKRAFESDAPDASRFVARRMALGGVGALVPLVAGYSAGGQLGIIAGGIFLSLLRSGSKALTDPNVLKPLKTALKPKASDGIVIAATIRALRAWGDDEALELADELKEAQSG